MKIGWIGCGQMGLPMCSRLAKAGHVVTVYEHVRPLRHLVPDAVTCVHDMASLVGSAEVVVTMLPGPAEVMESFLGEQGILSTAAAGALCIDMSTSSPALAARLAREGAERGLLVADAPVSGGPAGAADGSLSIMVGGSRSGFDAAREVLSCLGSVVTHQGGPGSGQRLKLVNQIMVAAVTLAACEAFALTEAAGLDQELAREAILGGVAGSRLVGFLWSRLVAGDMQPGFKIAHLAKDLGLTIEEGVDRGVELPLSKELLRSIDRARDKIGGDLGTQALVRALSPTTGSDDSADAT